MWTIKELVVLVVLSALCFALGAWGLSGIVVQ